ncbi:hypothetical protein GCM10022205_18350 [Spinactinospora alkalitolerans]
MQAGPDAVPGPVETPAAEQVVDAFPGPGRVGTKPPADMVFLVVDSSTGGFAHVLGDMPRVSLSVPFALMAMVSKQALSL